MAHPLTPRVRAAHPHLHMVEREVAVPSSDRPPVDRLLCDRPLDAWLSCGLPSVGWRGPFHPMRWLWGCLPPGIKCR